MTTELLQERDRLVAVARDSIRRGSKSFFAASTLFDPPTRERAWLLYAWCRATDDMIDGQVLGQGPIGAGDPVAALADVRTLTTCAIQRRPTGHDPFDALAVVARECGLRQEHADAVIAGFALDVGGFIPQTQQDMEGYCYHVAGAVGVMMAIVMGIDPADDAILDRACDLGIAFQLSNIARDVMDDAAAGRCYLPGDWLRDEGLAAADLQNPAARPAVARIARRLAQLASRYAESGRGGAIALPRRSAWAVRAAAGIYGGIAQKVADGGATAWDRRISTSSAEKLAWIVRAGLETLVRPGRPPVEREGLWTRPRTGMPLQADARLSAVSAEPRHTAS